MGPLGHCAVGMAAKPMASRVPLGVLLIAPFALDLLAVGLGFAGIESDAKGIAWSHGLFMSAVWSALAGVLGARMFHDRRSGVVIGLLVFSHWVLDFISHPIPFSSFSWRHWQWDYGHAIAPDLPLLFAKSPKVGLGLYNHISAVEATVLEFAMFVAGTAVYLAYRGRNRRKEN